jgi:hypothetical protein
MAASRKEVNMKLVPVETTKLTLPDIAELAKAGTIVLTRRGRPLATAKSVAGSDWESVALANNPDFIAIIEESRRSYREEGGLSFEEVRKNLGLKKPPTRRRKETERRKS